MPISVAIPPDLRDLSAPLGRIVHTALTSEKRTVGEVAIVLTDDADLRMLNQQWRGIDRATDVLSFSYDEDAPVRTAAVNGDLAISMDRMRAQAKRYRVSLGAELARLVIHGTLHLAGLDHQQADEREHMRRREEAALERCRAAIAALDKALAPKPVKAAKAAKRPAKRAAKAKAKAAPKRAKAAPKRKPATRVAKKAARSRRGA